MTKREQLEKLRTAQDKLKELYESMGEHKDGTPRILRAMVLNIIRQDIGPVAHNLQNEIEQEELDND